jgi:DNA-binding MarR family transcriptional regulator
MEERCEGAPVSSTPSLVGEVDRAERVLRVLFERLLDEAGLSFSEWIVLSIIDAAGPIPRSDLVWRQVDGLKVPVAMAGAAVDGLLALGFLAPNQGAERRGAGTDTRLAITGAGEAVSRQVRQAVYRVADQLSGDLPSTDLEATYRTLAEITRRARVLRATWGTPNSAA